MDRTRGITVSVFSQFIAQHSIPAQNHYLFAYTIKIINRGSEPVQLRERYWLITNAEGKQTEVQGEGVVGEQPIIAPGGEYQYRSAVVLETPCGTMQGHYVMETAALQRFRAEIECFRLAATQHLH